MMRVALCALFALGSVTAAGATAPSRETFATGLAALAERDFHTAELRFRAVIAADPNAHEAYNNLAVALAQQGRDEEAAAALQTALRLRADYDRARQNLAAVYVRLAVKQLLLAAEQADGPRRVALAARAREVLIAGPNLPPPDLLTHADQLASAAALSGSSPAAPATAAATATAALAPSAAGISLTPTVTPVAAAESVGLFIEPVGAQVLILDPLRRRAALYRRGSNAFERVGNWPLEWRGVVPAAGVRAVTRQTEWSVRVLEPAAQVAARWVIEVATKATKSADAAVLAAGDFGMATGTLTPGRDVVIISANASEPSLDAAAAQQVRERLELWRSAWARRDSVAYAALYGSGFVDDGRRPLAEWRRRKRELFERSGEVNLKLRDVVITVAGEDALSSFAQEYRSALERSHRRKLLRWRRAGGEWLIVAEQVTSPDSATGE